MKNFLQAVAKRWYVLLGIVIVIVVAVKVISGNAATTNIKDNPLTVKRQDLKEVLSFAGSIDAEEHAVLQFQTGGRLAWVGVKEGDTVKKYQSIASLDTRSVQKNLQKYLNTFSNTRTTFDQTNDDYDTKTLDMSADIRAKAKRLIDQSQFTLNNSVLDVEIQNLALEYSSLFTPIAGIVTRVDAPYAGVNISQATQFEVVNPNTLFFSATADQTEVTQLSIGQTGSITFDAFSDNPQQGVVSSIGYVPKAGETGTVYQIKVKFPDSLTQKYRIGMTGDISFTTKERKNVLAVPANYVKKDTSNNSEYVITVLKGKKQNSKVQAGETIDGSTIITSGITEGDIVYDKAQ